MKKFFSVVLVLLLVLSMIPGAMADDSDLVTLGRVTVVMPEIKMEIHGTGYRTTDIKASLDSDELAVENVHVYNKKTDSAHIYVVVDLSTTMETPMYNVIKILKEFIKELGPNEKMTLITVDSKDVKVVLDGDESLTEQEKAINKLSVTTYGSKFYEALSYVYQLSNASTEVYDREYVLAFSNGIGSQRGTTTYNEALELYKTHNLPLFACCASSNDKNGPSWFGEIARSSGGSLTTLRHREDFKTLKDDFNNMSIVTLRAPNNIADGQTHPLTVEVKNTQVKLDVPVTRHTPDRTPPSASAFFNLIDKSVDVTFSEPVSGAMEPGNYILRNEQEEILPVTIVEDKGDNRYALRVDGLTNGSYTLTFQGINDMSQEANVLKSSLAVLVDGLDIPVDVTPKKEGLPLWLILTIAGVALLAIAGIVLAIVANARKKKANELARSMDMNALGPDGQGGSSEIYDHQGPGGMEIKHHVITPDEGLRVRLLIRTGRTAEQTVDVSIVSSLIVGRSDICDVYLDDAKLSRQHFVIENSEGSLFIQDLGSRNGTWLNGIVVKDRQPLASGDRIRAGVSDITITY